jgi:hypothetical protein
MTVASIVLAVSLAACGGSTKSNPTTPQPRPTPTTARTTTTTHTTTSSPQPTNPTPVYARPIHATLVGEDHEPTVNKNWTYSITVTDAKGQKLGGTETTQYTFNGSVVGTEKPENVPFKNGYYHDTVQFPAAAVGVALDVQAVVHTSIGSITRDWPITVKN